MQHLARSALTWPRWAAMVSPLHGQQRGPGLVDYMSRVSVASLQMLGWTRNFLPLAVLLWVSICSQDFNGLRTHLLLDDLDVESIHDQRYSLWCGIWSVHLCNFRWSSWVRSHDLASQLQQRKANLVHLLFQWSTQTCWVNIESGGTYMVRDSSASLECADQDLCRIGTCIMVATGNITSFRSFLPRGLSLNLAPIWSHSSR